MVGVQFDAPKGDKIYGPGLDLAKRELKDLAGQFLAGDARMGAISSFKFPEAGNQQFKVLLTGDGVAPMTAQMNALAKTLIDAVDRRPYHTGHGNVLVLSRKETRFHTSERSLILRTLKYWPEAEERMIDVWYAVRGKVRPVPF